MYFYFMGIWLSARFTHAACEKAERWINKVERKINKIHCRKPCLPIAFLSCVCRGTKLAGRFSTLVTSLSSTGRSNREDKVQGHAERRWRMCTFLTIFLVFYLLHHLVCYTWCEAPRHRRHPSSPLSTKLFRRLLKFQSFRPTPAPLHAPTWSVSKRQTARRKENSEAANLADFALCCCNAQLAKREGLIWVSNFLRTLVRKSWSTVSNSPGALCRISSSVAGLIPGERTSATPRSVLQISDRHLRRYPIRIELRNSSSELPDPGSVNAADIAGGWIAKDNVT